MQEAPPKAAPRIRLSYSEVSTADLHTPGNIPRLLKKLANLSQSPQIERGTACTRCKSRKRKCEGTRPCKACVKANVPCDAIFRGEDLQRIESASQAVDWPMPAPPSYKFAARDMLQATASFPPPMMVGNIMRVGFDYGLPLSTQVEMFAPMPPKLLGALGQLLQRLVAAGPPPLDPIPEDAIERLKSMSNVMGMVVKRDPRGMCEELQFGESRLWDKALGAHAEEVSARLAARDMPVPTPEYRALCGHLHHIHETMVNPGTAKHFVIVMRVCQTNPGKGDGRMSFIRASAKPYADGVVSTAVEMRPEEYDRAVAQDPAIRGHFIECDMSAQEILQSKDLFERERIAAMVQTPEGRAKLDRLADKITTLFRLNVQWPPPPPSLSSRTCSTDSGATTASNILSTSQAPESARNSPEMISSILQHVDPTPLNQPLEHQLTSSAFQPSPAARDSSLPVECSGISLSQLPQDLSSFGGVEPRVLRVTFPNLPSSPPLFQPELAPGMHSLPQVAQQPFGQL